MPLRYLPRDTMASDSALPAEIQQYLIATRHIAYVTADRTGVVLSASGCFKYFGLDVPQVQKEIIAELPFLAGLFPELSSVVESFPMQFGTGKPFRLEMFETDEIVWVFLYSPIDGDIELQHHMQRRNEALLIKEEQAAILKNLESVNLQLKKFAATTAHDLKTPAANTEALADLFLDDYGDLFDEEGKELLNLMIGSAQRMRTLISETLAFAAGRAAATELSSVDIAEVVGIVGESVSGLNLEVRSPLPMVRIARVHLERVLQNLLVNAVEASAPGSTVYVSCEDLQKEWRICVADSGSGIPLEKQEEVFMQGVSSKEDTSDAHRGLGLWIVKSLVEGWGGAVSLQSKPGEGTSMYFTIPKSDASD